MPRTHRKIPELTAQEIQRFWGKVNKAPGQGPHGKCWLWQGKSLKKGYGVFSVRRNDKVIDLLAHRVAYYLANDADPAENLVCHQCDTPACCSAQDFFLGTYADNNADMRKKGRAVTNAELSSALKRKVAEGWRPCVPPERVRRGENHPCAKLTEADVLSIRLKYSGGSVSTEWLARHYHVRYSAIYKILHGKTWRLAPGPIVSH